MPLVNIAPPTTEIISVAEARFHLKETNAGSDIDDKLSLLIRGVRELAENDCRRAFITQRWRMVLGGFPRPAMNISSATWYGPQWGVAPGPLQNLAPDSTSGYEIYLPLPRLQGVDSVTYVDQDGVTQSMNVSSDLIVNNVVEPAVLLPAYGTSWPATRIQAMAVTIEYTCGYGDDVADVPACIKMWCLAALGSAYNLPEGEFAAFRETLLMPAFVDRLLDPARVRRY